MNILRASLFTKEIQDLKVNFEEDIKPTYYLAFALSLPFGPIFQPLHKEWIVEPLLNHEIGQDKFKQRTRIISGIELFSNAIFFSLVFFYIWKLVWKLKVNLIKWKTAYIRLQGMAHKAAPPLSSTNPNLMTRLNALKLAN